jgi:hypothetical protein
MAKHKVSELEGALLDAAVAKAEGLPVHPGPGRYLVAAPIDTVWAHQFHPSTDWRDGGPIIERERIAVSPGMSGDWWARGPTMIDRMPKDSRGPTPLIAAMRSYVALRLGGEVELP